MSRFGSVSCCRLQHEGDLPIVCPVCKRVHWREVKAWNPDEPEVLDVLVFAAALVLFVVMLARIGS